MKKQFIIKGKVAEHLSEWIMLREQYLTTCNEPSLDAVIKLAKKVNLGKAIIKQAEKESYYFSKVYFLLQHIGKKLGFQLITLFKKQMGVKNVNRKSSS